MKAYDFARALGEVDGKYIEEAITYKKPAQSLRIWRAVAIAACVCLAATLGLAAAGLNNNQKTVDSAAPRAAFSDTSSYYQEPAAEEAYQMPALMAVEEAVEESADYEIAMDDFDAPLYGNETSGVWDSAESTEAGAAQNPDSKIIYYVTMDMETTDFDAALDSLEGIISDYDGYSESQNIYNRSGDYRSADYVVRIPAENLDAFLSKAGEICTVIRSSRSAEDVSESYYDTQSRLETAQTKLARLQELLTQAENMEDIISIENAISDVQWEIDNYSGSLKYYDSRISYSTVTINVSEVYEVVIDDAPVSFGDRIVQAFNSGIRGFGSFLKDLALWIINSWIWLLLLAVIIVVVLLIVRKVRRNRKTDRQ